MFGAYSVPTHSPIKSVSRDCAIRESQRSGRREGGSPAEAALASSSKRFRLKASEATSERRILMAASRPSRVSLAR